MSSAAKEGAQHRPKAEGKATLRLARFGRHGQGGPSRFYFKGAGSGRLYKRDGLYRVDAEAAKLLLSTGKFELVPDRLIEQAKKEARTPRGVTLEQRAAERRKARMSDRHRPHGLEEAERVMVAAAEAQPAGDELVVDV